MNSESTMKTLTKKDSNFGGSDYLAHGEKTHLFSHEDNPRLLRRLAQRLINAHEEERQRISQELHDDLGNRIALIALSLDQIIRRQSPANSSSSLRQLQKTLD